MRLNDPELVRREYADESGLSARIAAQESSTGPDPRQVAFEAVAETSPRRVLEVGPGRGELAARIRDELGAEVVAVDQSPRMVELTRARGVEAIVGDVQDLPFPAGQFDCALAAWMLYHVPDLDQALRELRRVLTPHGRLVAVTNSERNACESSGSSSATTVPAPGASAPRAARGLLAALHDRRAPRRPGHGHLSGPGGRLCLRGSLADPLAPGRPSPVLRGPAAASRHVVVFVCEP